MTRDESPAWLLVAVGLFVLLVSAACIDLPPVQPNRPMVTPPPTPEPPSLVMPTQDPGELTSSIIGGKATWYDDGPGLYGAVPTWQWGDRRYAVEVCLASDSSRCVTVTVRDFCACGDRSGEPTVIDLSPAAFSRLAPLSRGVIAVTVSDARVRGIVPTPPATDR